MAKMKVFELAKKLKIESEFLIDKMQEMGIPVEGEEETLESEEVKILEEKIKEEKSADMVEERIKPTVIRRRAKKESKPVPEPKVKETAEEKPKDEVDTEKKQKKDLETNKKVSPALKESVEPLKKEEEEEPQEGKKGLRKRIKTIPKEEAVQALRPTIIKKPARDEGIPKEMGAPSPPPKDTEKVISKKKESEKKRKRKKKAQFTEKTPSQIRSLKKREVLIKSDQAAIWGETKQPPDQPQKKAKPAKKPAKHAKKTFLKPAITTPKASKRIIKIEEVISVGEMARKMGVKAGDLIKKLMALGMMANINHIIDLDTASLVAQDFGYEVENVAFEEGTLIKEVEDKEEDLTMRPPVVTIMGHVDHGKTTLLDAIRKTNVVGEEFGGITQHIGAYEVKIGDKEIVFLDTPGHEAFTTMRARGAQVTDIVILVVAADDGVMPQTVEAINHAKAAGVPIIVAINKIDKPDADVARAKKELMVHGLVSEDLGGETIYVEISAKKQLGLGELLEMIIIQSEVMELRANPKKPARGVVIEATLDRGRGPVATVLIKEGTLSVGDHLITGLYSGRVRALINDKGEHVTFMGPSKPVEILGLGGVPEAGDPLIVIDDEKTAKEVATHRQLKAKEKEMVAPQTKVTLEELYQKIQEGGMKELNLIIKADVQGSVEALIDNLIGLSNEEVKVVIMHSATGSITESDVMLASASDAIIIGFSVRPEPKVTDLAEHENVEIRLYNVIYDCVDNVKKAITGMLAPKLVEKAIGKAEVRDIFNIPKIGAVAGSYITDGKMIRGSNVRLIRDNQVIHEGKITSLRRFKDDVKEVASGFECGIKIDNYNDIEPADIIEAYEIEEVSAEI